jgi:hypothetical protein
MPIKSVFNKTNVSVFVEDYLMTRDNTCCLKQFGMNDV